MTDDREALREKLAAVTFPWPAQVLAWEEYRQATSEAHERVERLTQALHDQVEQWRWYPVVRALMTLRGLTGWWLPRWWRSWGLCAGFRLRGS